MYCWSNSVYDVTCGFTVIRHRPLCCDWICFMIFTCTHSYYDIMSSLWNKKFQSRFVLPVSLFLSYSFQELGILSWVCLSCNTLASGMLSWALAMKLRMVSKCQGQWITHGKKWLLHRIFQILFEVKQWICTLLSQLSFIKWIS